MKTIQRLGMLCTLVIAVACGSVAGPSSDAGGGAPGIVTMVASGSATSAGAAGAPAMNSAGAPDSAGAGDAASAGEPGAGGEAGAPTVAEAGAAGDAGADDVAPVVLSGFHATEDSEFWDTKLFTQEGSATVSPYKLHDPQARYVIQTSATSVTLNVVRWTGTGHSIDVFVNGTFSQSALFGGVVGAADTATITLPAGAKTVEFEEQLVALTGINCDSFTVSMPIAPAGRVVCVGDSITEGASSFPESLDWVSTIRHRGRVGAVLNYGLSGRRLLQIAGTSALRDAFVQAMADRLDGTSKNTIYIALGTNDYGAASTGQTPDVFGSALGLALDELRARLPHAIIDYQSPLPRTVETTNLIGFTCSDYRAAGQAACAARPSIHFVDGALMPVELTSDGLHPDNVGHATLANDIDPLLQAE